LIPIRFKRCAQKGKPSNDWFFVLKRHIVINKEGALIRFRVTSGKTHDRQVVDSIRNYLQGWLFSDRGSIGKKLAKELSARSLD
jgi:hypothetical protein